MLPVIGSDKEMREGGTQTKSRFLSVSRLVRDVHFTFLGQGAEGKFDTV